MCVIEISVKETKTSMEHKNKHCASNCDCMLSTKVYFIGGEVRFPRLPSKITEFCGVSVHSKCSRHSNALTPPNLVCSIDEGVQLCSTGVNLKSQIVAYS